MGIARILTLNGGSSSLKYSLYDVVRPDDPSPVPVRVASGGIGRIGTDVPDHGVALERALERLAPSSGGEPLVSSLLGIVHRIVHGGPSLYEPTLLGEQVLNELRRIQDLDPDHLPAEIAVVEAMARNAPTVPQVACFDTAFHRTMPRLARLLPIPLAYEARGVRRYGFHGLSYEYLVAELGRVAGAEAARGRVVLAHLGAGSSLTAVRGGVSIDTTMAFTPNAGVPMATRSGDLDPGVLLYLMRSEGLDADQLDDLLSRRSGLLGLSETSGDMRDLQARAASDPRAADAVAVFCYRVRKAIGELAAALDGLDALVFAGGIGENSAEVRARVAEGLGHLGVSIDAQRNRAGEGLISSDASRCAVRVIRTDEEAILVRHALRVLGVAPAQL